MKTLYVKNRSEWRTWLAKHGASTEEIWLVYYKKDSGKPRIPYDDAVEEALCFGWIDGQTGKIDSECFAQRFTPRRPASRWSPINITRARKLIREGQMTPAGQAVFDPRRKTEAHPTVLPDQVLKKFKTHATAWNNFGQFPPYYQRMSIAWVASAKKEETQLRRLSRLMEFSSRNERIKFM